MRFESIPFMDFVDKTFNLQFVIEHRVFGIDYILQVLNSFVLRFVTLNIFTARAFYKACISPVSCHRPTCMLCKI